MHVTADRRTDAARPFRERLPGELDGVPAAGWLRDEPRGVALSGAWLGGTTILTSHPLLALPAGEDPLAALDRLPIRLDARSPGQPPVVGGGWFGWLGFGLAAAVEPVSPPPPRARALPRFDLAFYDHVVLRDAAGDWWFEALWTAARAAVLSERLACWRARLAGGGPPPPGRFMAAPLRASGPGLAGHAAAVAEAVQRIAAGELSQANLCLRLESRCEGDPLALWTRAAAACRPAYGAYVAAGRAGHALASVSPELFLRRTGSRVQTRPVKGTAPLESDPAALAASTKDRAENVMIVDLMRNDLGRVCRYGSGELCAVGAAPGVWQLESSVSGELRPGVGDAELLRATFPPGSVTGAPKVQALRTIYGLEASGREAYCGAIGLVSPLAGLELNVAIRTFEVDVVRGRVWLGVGGGIVADSSAGVEVAEALTKARGVLSAAGLALARDGGAGGLALAGGGGGPGRPAGVPFARAARPDPAAGVFETLRVSAGRARHLAEHLARLAASCDALGLRTGVELGDRGADEAAALGEGALRITVGPGGVCVTTRPLPPAGATELLAVIVPGGLGVHKWADRGLIDAHSGPERTPLICDSDGSVLEAGYAAVLWVCGGRLLAPPLDRRLLPSLSRERLLAAARSGGWETGVRAVSLADLAEADAIVLCSSLRGPHPGRLAGRALPAGAKELCRRLAGLG